MKTSPTAHCEEIRHNLSAFVDGELTKSERSIVDGHLRECGGCRDRLPGVLRTGALGCGLPPGPLGRKEDKVVGVGGSVPRRDRRRETQIRELRM